MKSAWYWRVALYLAATVVVAISVFPFIYAVSTSFKSGSALFEPVLWPSSVTLANYVSLFSLAEQPFGRHILNSIMVSVLVVSISLFIGVTASFALGRINIHLATNADIAAGTQRQHSQYHHYGNKLHQRKTVAAHYQLPL